MVLEQQHVVLLQVGGDGFGYFVGGGGAVGGQGNGADGDDGLNHGVLVKAQARNGVAGSRGRMGVNDAVYIVPLLIAAQVHLDLGGGLVAGAPSRTSPLSLMRTSFSGVMKLLLMPVGVARKVPSLKRTGNVSVVGGNPAQLPHFVTDVTDLVFDRIEVFHEKIAPFL